MGRYNNIVFGGIYVTLSLALASCEHKCSPGYRLEGDWCRANDVSDASAQGDASATGTEQSPQSKSPDGGAGGATATPSASDPAGTIDAGTAPPKAVSAGAGATGGAGSNNDPPLTAGTSGAVGGAGTADTATQCANQRPSGSQRDGCCPPSANSSVDADCSVACGNGVVEPGEKHQTMPFDV